MAYPGDLLRLARQRTGMTQKAAATRLKIAQAVVSRIENGLIEPDDELLQRAAKAYEVPVDFFSVKETVYGPPVSVHTMLRGRSDVSGREIDIITAELNIRLFHLRRFLENVDYNPELNLPTLDVEQYEDVSRIAAIVRAHWKLPDGPIGNLTDLVERAGVIIGTSSFRGAQVSGVTFHAPGTQPIILLNPTHPADRVRFTLAHELGHLVMHRFPTPSMEQEANRFASNLLLPPQEMRQVFRGRKINLELLAALKKEWRVSMQSVLMSAHTLGFLTDNQSRYLWQQLSVKGWRTREPADLDFSQDNPTVLPAILRAHINDLGFSIADLVSISRLHEHDFMEMYGSMIPVADGAEPDHTKPRLRVVK